MELNIKNKVFTLPAKVINILDFDANKLGVQKEGDDEIGIYYIDYDDDAFYLVIDDLKGYFEKDDEGHTYLTMIFASSDDKMKYDKVWQKIKKLINKVTNGKLSNYNKDYGVITFETDDMLPFGYMIKICSMTIVIRSVLRKDGFYPQFFFTLLLI